MPQLHRPNLNLTTVDVSAWTSNYIPLFCVDDITYPRPNTATGLANFC